MKKIQFFLCIILLIIFFSISNASHIYAQATTSTKIEVTYTTINNVPLKLDICSPKNPTAAMPTLVFIHGGGFRAGDKDQGTNFFCPFLPDHGYIFVSVNYRLASEAQYPSGFDDVQYAIRWIRKNAETYHINPNQIASSGSSAGSTFASLLGVRETRKPSRGLSEYSSKVQAVIPIAGVQNFNGALGSFNPRQYYFNNNEETILDASPLTHLTSDDSPFLLIHGSNDTTVLPIQTTIFAKKLEELHIPHQIIIFNGGHGIGSIPSSKKTDTLHQIIAFLHTHFNEPSSSHTPTPIKTSTPAPTSTHSPTSTPIITTLQGDINHNRKVDTDDYNILLSNFGKKGASGWIGADIIKNGVVDIYDYAALAKNFGKTQ